MRFLVLAVLAGLKVSCSLALLHQVSPSERWRNNSVGEVIETLLLAQAPGKTVEDSLLASPEVKSQVEHEKKKAMREGLAEMEEATKEAQQKWVSEVSVVVLEDQAKLKEAVAKDLEKVKAKVKAVEDVQRSVLQRMKRDVEVVVGNVSHHVLIASARMARNQTEHLVREALEPSITAIGQGEEHIEELRSDALERQQDAQSTASRLFTSAQEAEAYVQGLTQMPEEAAHELHQVVDKDLTEVKKAKAEAKSALKALREAEEEAKTTLDLANVTEAEAAEILQRALQQAEEIKELEQRTKAQQAQAANATMPSQQ